MNSIYKNKILYILNIIVKTETLNCRYLVSKSLVVSVSDTNFKIAPCTVPVFNYNFERLKIFGGFYMVR